MEALDENMPGKWHSATKDGAAAIMEKRKTKDKDKKDETDIIRLEAEGDEDGQHNSKNQ
jgi:hypothetical protein